VIGWIALLALVSVFVSNPFQSETSAAAAPNYWHHRDAGLSRFWNWAL